MKDSNLARKKILFLIDDMDRLDYLNDFIEDQISHPISWVNSCNFIHMFAAGYVSVFPRTLLELNAELKQKWRANILRLTRNYNMYILNSGILDG